MENKILLFNKWDTENITIDDPGLKNYITLRPIFAPKTGGRNIKIKFHKSKSNIVERLITKCMVVGHKGKKHKVTSGRNTGKATKNYKMVFNTFKIIEEKLKQNPVMVFVKAVENSAPREEITSIEYGGARYPQPVDCSPQRRVDIALRMITQGAYHKSFRNKKKAEEFLAEEIILAYNNDNKSIAVAKKMELE